MLLLLSLLLPLLKYLWKVFLLIWLAVLAVVAMMLARCLCWSPYRLRMWSLGLRLLPQLFPFLYPGNS